MLKGAKAVYRIWIVSAIIVFILGLLIFGAYWHFLPNISNDHTAWSSFGSLLSGFFTLSGVIATIATLLFLNAQNQNHQSFVEWQIKALTLDHYINHRRLFIERLVELQNAHNNAFRFPSTESSYNGIFPRNNPTNVDTVVLPIHDENSNNVLGELINLFEQTFRLIKLPEWTTADITNLFTCLSFISYKLDIEWVAETIDGDVLHDGDNIGVNIYFLEDGIRRLISILNSHLFFTGNPAIESTSINIGEFQRDAIIRHFLQHRFNNGIIIFKEAPSIVEFEELYLELEAARDSEGRRLLPGTHRWLDIIFSLKDPFDSFREGLIQSTVLNSGMHECTKILEDLSVDNPNYDYLKKLNLRLLNLSLNL